MTRARLGLVAFVSLLGALCLGARANEISRGDDAWLRRAEGEQAGKPLRAPALEAVQAYESALVADPTNLEARWKLLRALHFSGEFAVENSSQMESDFLRACNVAEVGLALLSKSLGEKGLEELDISELRRRLGAAGISERDVARLHFWSAINWGAWGQNAGLMSLVREGVANRLHRYARVTLALEPELEGGGAFRLLGRLHAQLPRVPLVTGWVDRNRSIPLLERAMKVEPSHPGNRLLLALSLLDLAPERHAEALGLLREVDRLTPRPAMRVEDLAIRREARKRLASVGGSP